MNDQLPDQTIAPIAVRTLTLVNNELIKTSNIYLFGIALICPPDPGSGSTGLVGCIDRWHYHTRARSPGIQILSDRTDSSNERIVALCRIVDQLTERFRSGTASHPSCSPFLRAIVSKLASPKAITNGYTNVSFGSMEPP